MANSDNEGSNALLSRIRSIVHKHGGNGICDDIYPLDDLAQTVEKNCRNVEQKVFFYKWFGFSLLVLLPIISTVLSIFISENKNAIVPYLSYILTILTVLNSILKPGERFRQACSLAIKIEQFKSELLANLIKLPKLDEASLVEFSDKYRKEFVLYQEQLVGLFLPETAMDIPKPNK